MEVVDQNATLLQEIPLFSSQEPVNNILLHKVDAAVVNSSGHTTSDLLLRDSDGFLCVQGRALVGSPLSLAHVQAEGCGLYPNCEVCARVRHLGCVWNTQEDACRYTDAK